MISGRSNVMTADPSDFERDLSPASRAGEPLWSRWLNRVVGAVRGLSVRRPGEGMQSREPIFRIAQIWRDRWIVERPGAAIEYAFPDLDRAVAFIRHESGVTPATVELRIGDLYVVAHFDPNQPGSLFGESVS